MEKGLHRGKEENTSFGGEKPVRSATVRKEEQSHELAGVHLAILRKGSCDLGRSSVAQ